MIDITGRWAVNSTAARVISKGVHYEPQLKKLRTPDICQKEPLQTIKLTWEQLGLNKKTFPDLTGQSNGRMDVIGYYGKTNKKQKGKWVCKCKCGNYTLREAAAIKRWKDGSNDCCRECRHLESLRNK